MLVTIAALFGAGSAAYADEPQVLDKPPFGLLVTTNAEWAGIQIDRFHVGVWADASFRASNLDGEGTNLSVDHFNVFADLRFEDGWQVFVEAEVEHQSNVGALERESEVELEQAYLQYTFSDAARIRLGRFATPLGILNPIHWTINTDTIVAPLFQEREFVPEQQVGASVAGRVFPGRWLNVDWEVDYTAWAGYASEAFQLDVVRGLSVGGDVRVGSHGVGFLGASVSRSKQAAVGGRRGRSSSGAIYGELSVTEQLTLRGEYFIRDSTRPGQADAYVHGVYGKVRWDYRDWSLNYRFERSDDPELGPDAVQRINRFTVGYALNPRIKLRAEYARHRTHEAVVPDFETFGLWLGVFF